MEMLNKKSPQKRSKSKYADLLKFVETREVKYEQAWNRRIQDSSKLN